MKNYALLLDLVLPRKLELRDGDDGLGEGGVDLSMSLDDADSIVEHARCAIVLCSFIIESCIIESLCCGTIVSREGVVLSGDAAVAAFVLHIFCLFSALHERLSDGSAALDGGSRVPTLGGKSRRGRQSGVAQEVGMRDPAFLWEPCPLECQFRLGKLLLLEQAPSDFRPLILARGHSQTWHGIPPVMVVDQTGVRPEALSGGVSAGDVRDALCTYPHGLSLTRTVHDPEVHPCPCDGHVQEFELA